jgi:cell division septation protein DedD
MRYGHHDRVEPEFAAPHRDDDAQDEIPARSGIPRWAALALAGGAVIAFGGVVAYGYLTYADRHGATPAPLVVADQRPVRVKPDHDGGTAVPHQNIEVFDAGQRGQRSALPRGAETLLPPPETPLPKPVPAPVAQQVAVVPPVAAPRQTAAGDVTQAAIGDVAAPAPSPPPPPPPAPQPGAAVAGAPQRVAAVAAAGAPAARSGGFRIQVGAMRTEAEARAVWEQVSRRHPEILGRMAPSYSRAELGERGSFFRVQAGPLPSRDAAREACERLTKAGTVCLVVPPS